MTISLARRTASSFRMVPSSESSRYSTFPACAAGNVKSASSTTGKTRIAHNNALERTRLKPRPLRADVRIMIEEIWEENELVLVKVKIYESGEFLRANLYFTGKKDMVLRNYRASDAVALGAFYKIPILVRKNLLKASMEA